MILSIDDSNASNDRFLLLKSAISFDPTFEIYVSTVQSAPPILINKWIIWFGLVDGICIWGRLHCGNGMNGQWMGPSLFVHNSKPIPTKLAYIDQNYNASNRPPAKNASKCWWTYRKCKTGAPALPWRLCSTLEYRVSTEHWTAIRLNLLNCSSHKGCQWAQIFELEIRFERTFVNSKSWSIA